MSVIEYEALKKAASAAAFAAAPPAATGRSAMAADKGEGIEDKLDMANKEVVVDKDNEERREVMEPDKRDPPPPAPPPPPSSPTNPCLPQVYRTVYTNLFFC